jgi:hypothetical protein
VDLFQASSQKTSSADQAVERSALRFNTVPSSLYDVNSNLCTFFFTLLLKLSLSRAVLEYSAHTSSLQATPRHPPGIIFRVNHLTSTEKSGEACWLFRNSSKEEWINRSPIRMSQLCSSGQSTRTYLEPGATDFVELPLILMEHFLDSPDVLSLFDADSTTTLRQMVNHHHDPCHSIDTYSQILLATVDQVYHSPAASQHSLSSTNELL